MVDHDAEPGSLLLPAAADNSTCWRAPLGLHGPLLAHCSVPVLVIVSNALSCLRWPGTPEAAIREAFRSLSSCRRHSVYCHTYATLVLNRERHGFCVPSTRVPLV